MRRRAEERGQKTDIWENRNSISKSNWEPQSSGRRMQPTIQVLD